MGRARSLLRRQLRRLVSAGLCCFVLAGCTLPAEQLTLPGALTSQIATTQPSTAAAATGTVPLASPADRETLTNRTWAGSGRLVGPPDGGNSAGVRQSTADGITLNLVDASIPEVARTVLGEILGVTYVVDPRLRGTVTLRTAQPVAREALVDILEQVLKTEGAVLLVENNVYRIVPSDAIASQPTPLRSGARGRRPGYATEILAPRYVSAAEVERVLKAVAPQAAIQRVDESRNVLLVAGTGVELASIRETLSVFDVDWMRGMSFAMHPVESGEPEAIAQELDTIFANDRDSPIKGVVRFIPNRRLKSILVITSRPEYLPKVQTWIQRIDLASRATEKQVNVYHVQNRPAGELAVLLQRVYAQQRGGSSAQAPATTGAIVTSGPADILAPLPPDGLRRLPDGVQPAGPLPPPVSGPSSTGPAATPLDILAPAGSATPPPAAVTGDDRASGIAVVPDESNNALIITATPAEFKRVRQILARLDIAPAQVLLEATIAEVTLTDQLKFGLRWFFEKGGSEFRLSDAATGAVTGRFPGFSYFLNVPNVQVALNALASVTDVNVVSSPSLMVLDNKKATLQIGDEVPVATQSAVSVITPGAPIVNSVTFRSTGVILGITPRIGENGRVLLEIEQEVSDAIPTVSSGIDSPTIQQRRIKTTVAVGDGESIVLAGLMQDRSTVRKNQLPVVGNIPVLGTLFKDKDDELRRTELLIAITPQIVKDANQIRAIASEFRDRMNFSTRPQRRGPPDRREQVDRITR